MTFLETVKQEYRELCTQFRQAIRSEDKRKIDAIMRKCEALEQVMELWKPDNVLTRRIGSGAGLNGGGEFKMPKGSGIYYFNDEQIQNTQEKQANG